MSSYTTRIWREILDAPIGSTRLLGGREYEKVQSASGTTRWECGSRTMTNMEMYEATVG